MNCLHVLILTLITPLAICRTPSIVSTTSNKGSLSSCKSLLYVHVVPYIIAWEFSIYCQPDTVACACLICNEKPVSSYHQRLPQCPVEEEIAPVTIHCTLSVIMKPAHLPKTRPALPRISSNASGFFFCGIRELPVLQEPNKTFSISTSFLVQVGSQIRSDLYASEHSTKPASFVQKKISSSDMRDKCVITMLA